MLRSAFLQEPFRCVAHRQVNNINVGNVEGLQTDRNLKLKAKEARLKLNINNTDAHLQYIEGIDIKLFINL